MTNTAQIFNSYIQKENSTPDILDLDALDIDKVNGDFVISRDLDGNVLTRYKENVWNFEPYISDPSQHAIFDFEKSIVTNQIQNVKKLMLLLMIYGNGKDGSQYSVGTLKHYFTSLFRPLALFAKQNMTSIDKCLEDQKNLMRYVGKECTNRQRVSLLVALLAFLHNNDNNLTKINYKYNAEIIQKLYKLRSVFVKKLNQTEIIPIRILSESLFQRWEQIVQIERNIKGLEVFFKNFMNSEYFASSRHRVDKSLTFKEAVKKYRLEDLFLKYNISDRGNFLNFISNIQGTCAHLIHAYTGMRRGEVLNLKNDCIQEISNDSGVCYLVSTTSKLEGRSTTGKWVTSKETKRIVDLLNVLNKIIERSYSKSNITLPLFISFLAVLRDKTSKKIKSRRKIASAESLPLDYSKLTITAEDKAQIEYIDYTGKMKEIIVGEVWNFKSHQYRRSLAIYAIQSGLVSLGALQKQFKHTFREMTLYYANGASLARKMFDLPKEHIGNDFDKLKPEIDALVYIKDVLFSDEKLYGSHGKILEKNKLSSDYNLNLFLDQNRDSTIKKFKNGEMAYKETALGACVSLETCDSSLTRSFIACIECDSGILKKSKIENTIKQQKKFLNYLDKNSIEYRTELTELDTLEKMKDKLIKE